MVTHVVRHGDVPALEPRPERQIATHRILHHGPHLVLGADGEASQKPRHHRLTRQYTGRLGPDVGLDGFAVGVHPHGLFNRRELGEFSFQPSPSGGLRLCALRLLEIPQDVHRGDDALAAHALGDPRELRALFLLERIESHGRVWKAFWSLHVHQRLEADVAPGVVTFMRRQKIVIRIR